MPRLSTSIVVPTRDLFDSLHELLQSLGQCDRPPDEAIVIDDGSAMRLDAAVLDPPPADPRVAHPPRPPASQSA
jgi:hypothetical protein